MMNAAIYLSLVLCVVCDAASDVEQAFLDYEIVPSVFPVSPTKPINVSFYRELLILIPNFPVIKPNYLDAYSDCVSK